MQLQDMTIRFDYPNEWYEVLLYFKKEGRHWYNCGFGPVIHSCGYTVDYCFSGLFNSRCITCGTEVPKDLLSLASLHGADIRYDANLYIPLSFRNPEALISCPFCGKSYRNR